MADGEAMDYSYLPSGGSVSTIEVVDLARTRHPRQTSSRISSVGPRISWHPKLTLYRLLVILSTVGLAIAKTVTSYLNLSFASITLEWILGVVVYLFFHLLGVYEETSNQHFTWLFNLDYMEYLWVFLEKRTGFPRPYYVSDEINTRDQAAGTHPPVTGYRIIVTLVVASTGMTKSALLYGQQPTEATTVECVFGVGIATGLYWLGLYEASSTKVYPKLFHVDYSGGSSYITETAIMFLYLFALIVCSALSYGFYISAVMLLSDDMLAKSDGKGIVGKIALSILFVGGPSFMSLACAMGAFVLLFQMGWRYRVSPFGKYVARLPGVRLLLYVNRKYWLPSGFSLRPRPRLFYLKRFIIRQIIKIPLNLVLLCGLIMTVIFFVCSLLTWCSFAINLLEGGSWSLLLIHFLLSLCVVPTVLLLCAVIIRIGYRGVVDYFSEAWKDFTVEVESTDALVEVALVHDFAGANQ